ncbi:hypothetical protein OIU84_017497 [Salix udensis]|uniref:Uncharacterized protein n=1 Tax=Salix udensis TaxID=889485 RepID=A0AAD6L245_9ROSI|nr:hypothetical protein OIU84_017497 [Salix udensis]
MRSCGRSWSLHLQPPFQQLQPPLPPPLCKRILTMTAVVHAFPSPATPMADLVPTMKSLKIVRKKMMISIQPCAKMMKLMLPSSSFLLLCLLRGATTIPPLLLSAGTANIAGSYLSSSSKDKEHGEDCLVLHEIHAQPISQEEAAVAATFLGMRVDDAHACMLFTSTTNMVGSLHSPSSKILDKEHGVSHSKGLARVVVLAKGKDKVRLLPPPAAHGSRPW